MSFKISNVQYCLWNQFHVFIPDDVVIVVGDVVFGGAGRAAGVPVKNIYLNNLSYSNIKCYYYSASENFQKKQQQFPINESLCWLDF